MNTRFIFVIFVLKKLKFEYILFNTKYKYKKIEQTNKERKGIKMKKTKTIISAVLALTAIWGTVSLFGCSSKKESVLIYTSAEDFRVEDLKARLKEEFPDYDCIVEYKDTGSHAATLIAEGKNTDCDITYDLEYAYLEQLSENGVLADVSSYDRSVYTADAAVSNYYLPELRNGGAIIINPEVLEERNLAVPQSYEDLLKPEYKGLISMPNPKSSGTGYMFLKALIVSMGEDAAFDYFDKLSDNILSYTSSGSGPVNALKNKEAAIGLGMTAQAVNAINDGTKLDIMFFEEGSPYSMYGQAVISGKENRECVKKVFDFMINTYSKETNNKFYPEQIFKDSVCEVKNYPSNIKYTDMGVNTNAEKSRILEKWKY